jgi:hypothetical protein
MGENICAVTILFHHALKAASLTLDSTEPSHVRRFNTRIDCEYFASQQIRLVTAQTFFRRILSQDVLRCNHILSSSCELQLAQSQAVRNNTDGTQRHAALANPGLSSKPQTGYTTPAASGIPITLERNAQNKFCRITRIVPRESAIAAATPVKSLRISVTSPASIATSAPLAMLRLTSAWANADHH